MVVHRFEVYLVSLNPTVGNEIQKSRPCLIISPDEMNRHINTVIIAPMTTRAETTQHECPVPSRGGRGS